MIPLRDVYFPFYRSNQFKVIPLACTLHTRDLYHFLCMLPMTVARSSSGGVTKYQRNGTILTRVSPINTICYMGTRFTTEKGQFFGENVVAHCTAHSIYGEQCKTAEPMDMPFGKTPVSLIRRGYRSPNGKGQFSEVVRAHQKHRQSSL